MQARLLPILLVFGLILSAASVPAQKIIGELELKDFPTDRNIYPFFEFDRFGTTMVLDHEPALRLKKGEFIYLWQPERQPARKRMLSRYNLLLEEEWSTEVELSWEEDILQMLQSDHYVVILTHHFKSIASNHEVRYRLFDLDDGEMVEDSLLFTYKGRSDRELVSSLSPDSSRVLLYYYQREKNNKGNFFYDRVSPDGRAHYRANRFEKATVFVYDLELQRLAKKEIELGDKKMIHLDAQIDNEGNVYFLSFSKPQNLQATCLELESGKTHQLVYKDFTRFRDLFDPYENHFPATIGANKRLYVSHAERVTKGKYRGVKAWQIVNFDFDKKEIDLSRRADVNSTLMVRVEKKRKQFGLRPMRRFDQFLIKGLEEMPDGSLWLMTQKYERRPLSAYANNLSQVVASEHSIYELVMYEFAPSGRIHQAIIVPSSQTSRSSAEKAGDFYSMYFDKSRLEVCLLTREPSGEKLRGPERIYYRKVDLVKAEVSERKQIYDGVRRNQFFIRPYTIWHNQDLVSFMMIDGEEGEPFLVSINLAGEKDDEEPKERRKRLRQERKEKRRLEKIEAKAGNG
ncbi:MAG: hypothetical protein AAF206_01040 [Bacteroidota bacterium]